jgi:hypothetical protein
MNRFWRGIAIFVLGGVLGTGLGVIWCERFGVLISPADLVAARMWKAASGTQQISEFATKAQKDALVFISAPTARRTTADEHH